MCVFLGEANKWYQNQVKMSKRGLRLGDNDSPHHIMVERIIGGTIELPKLTKMNYHEWALEMQVNMEGMKL